MTTLTRRFLPLAALLLGVHFAAAQDPTPAAAPAPDAPATATAAAPAETKLPQKLHVLFKPAKPFVFQKNGAWTGFSVDLWKRVADELGVQFDAGEAKTVPEVLTALKDKKADVGVGALSITAERAQTVDFSYPFYESGLQILVKEQGGASMLSALKGISGDVFKALGVLVLALLVNAHILWFVERKKNAESFPEGYAAGIWEASWWSVCTLISGGCENKAPIGVAGRLFAVVWMLAGFGLVSFVTARMATAMTVNTLTTDIRTIGDLTGKPVGTVAGSSAERYLSGKTGATVKGYPDLDATVKAVQSGEVRAAVYDAPILQYYLSENGNTGLTLVGERYDQQGYGFAFQNQTDLARQVTLAILKLREEGFFVELDKKWFAPAE